MENAKTIHWSRVQFYKYNVLPHFSMLYGKISKLTKTRLIGDKRSLQPNWYHVEYDREYLINYICIKLLIPLATKNEMIAIGLFKEAWEAFLEMNETKDDFIETSISVTSDKPVTLFNANEQI